MPKLRFTLTGLLLLSVCTILRAQPAAPVLAEAPAPTPGFAGPPGLDKLDFRQVVQAAKAKVFPAVIYIRCLRESMEGGKKETIEVAGSGVIISADGQALTNWHVIDKATEVRVLTSSGQHFDAKVLGSDKDVDLALLQLQPPPGNNPGNAAGNPNGLPFAEIGDSSKLQEGDFVMAMGAPWGMNRSVSIGIISCATRYLPGRSEYNLWLQTDAHISPGNSGGPLVNTTGQIVGINTLGMVRGGEIGFAIPAEAIAVIIPQLRGAGKMNWSWTGLQLQPLRDFDRNMYFEGKEGVVVAETDPESPARHAGILPGDRILRINDTPVSALTAEDLPAVRRVLGLLPKGKAARLALQREGKPVAVELTPREKGKVEGEQFACPRWDLTVKVINQFDNPDLYVQRKTGVFIFGTKQPGNALNSGLRPQDIIVKIEDKDIGSLDDLKGAYKAAMDNLKSETKAKITVLHGGLMRQAILDFSRDYEKD